jgi:hypothetical protein
MATWHGRVARTPISPGGPNALTVTSAPAPTAPIVTNGREHAARDELSRLAGGLLDQPTGPQRSRHTRALTRILDWLESFPGEDWQDRWLLSGADQQGSGWGPQDLQSGNGICSRQAWA